ncbi:hypothetical protein BP5796_03116 [Coleophoma crateriformis]|uniref:Cytochrome b5 heme-binding domain-containing protein n=1 Tax=Coleophoma crateriformis TaxID=565419 RepID=A0A3D8SMC5_9HELO|nr:hypothetical protein BP5796_03116 [Coleophoma crateriformis]
MLLGLSILVASVSFLCYRHPPASWAFLAWLRRPSVQIAPAEPEEHNAPAKAMPHDMQKADEDNAISVIGDYLKELGAAEGESSSDEEDMEDAATTPSKAESDRKAMPPPPPMFKKPVLPAVATTISPPPQSTPTFNLEPSEDNSIPSFPAANSAQRASGGRGPPRLNAVPQVQPPLRSPTASLMSPPMRSPLPNRNPTSSSSLGSGLAPPPTHSAIPSKPSKKVLLTPGHSPLDWARLTSSPSENLRGVPANMPYLRVPPSLLKQMTGRKGKDAWTVLGGKVYNITPYLPYHPGGEPELMKCAGRDGTRLFGEVHPWVNYEGMLESCMVGIAVAEGDVPGTGGLEEMD